MRLPTGEFSNQILQAWERTTNPEEELTEEEKLALLKKQQGVASLYAEIEQPSSDIDKAKDTIVGSISKKLDDTVAPQTYSNGKKSLTELASDEEFSTRSERFLEGIESNENIFEYLRDAEYSLSSAIVRSFQTGKWTEEQKEDYNYLNAQFQNTDLKGFKEHFGLVKDLAGDVLLDPLNVISALFAIPTGGSTLAGRAALGKAAQQGVSAFTKSKLKTAIVKGNAKAYAGYGAAEGMAWGGLHNYFMQDMQMDLGLINDIDLTQTAASGLLGGLAGGAIGGVVGAATGVRYARFAEKEFKYANEDVIGFVGPNQRKLELDKWEIDQATRDVEELDLISQEEDVFFNIDSTPEIKTPFMKRAKELVRNKLPRIRKEKQHALNVFMARTTGKATTEFLEDAKKSPLLQNFLRKMRYDYDAKIIVEGERSVKTAKLKDGSESQWSFGEFVGRKFGQYHQGLNKSLNNLYRTGWRSRIVERQNDALYALLSNKNVGTKSGQGKKTIDKILKEGGGQFQGRKLNPGEFQSQGKIYKIDEDIASAYSGIRNLLDDSFDEAQQLNLFAPNTINDGGFFPRLYKFDVLLRKQDIFVDKLIKSGHADTINEKAIIEVITEDGTVVKGNAAGDMGLDSEIFELQGKYGVTSFEQLSEKILKEEIANKTRKAYTQLELQEGAKRLKAEEIVNGMIDTRYTPYELRKAGANNSMGFFQSRKFNKIKDEDISEFLETDVQQVLENYFTNMSQSQGRKKYFGNTLAEFEAERRLIINELQSNGVAREDAEKVGAGVGEMFKRVTGLETYSNSIFKNNKFGKNFSDIVKLSQQVAHLPFATVSSITEPLILLSRANPGDAGKTLRTIGSSLVKEGENMYDRMWKNIQRGTGKEIKGWKDVDDEVWGELYQTGLALEQAVQERIEGLAGEAMNSSLAKTLTGAFFKSNLLTQWTKAVQLASFTTGKRIVKQNTEQLYYNKTMTGRALTEENKKYLTKQLNELGVREDDALRWYKNSLDKNGNYDVNKARGIDGQGKPITDRYGNISFNGNFYSSDLIGAANRFTKEVILNPSTAEANRPLWFSRPDAQFLVQFAGYPTAFNNTILKKFINETVNNKTTAAPKIVATSMLMTAVAHVGNELRSRGKATIDYETGEKKPIHEIIGAAGRRWGAYGPADYAYRFDSEMGRNVGFLAGAIKSVGGPAIQDVADGILYRKGLAEIIAINAPYYSAYDLIFGEGTKKNIRRIASGKQEKVKKFKPIKYSKGGIVKNVPNVIDEPDEMQNRITGQPFNATSEAAQDIEDRELKGQMQGLGLREPFVIGGIAKALTKTIDNASSKRGQKLRKSYLDRSHLEKLDETVDERFVSLTMVKDLLEDKDITVTEAVDALKAGGYKQSVINKFIRPYKEIGLGK